MSEISSLRLNDKQPNFVLIMSDQHNPHIMGCEGNTIVLTPNLDALAGAEPLPGVKGKSFTPLLSEHKNTGDRGEEVFCEYIGAWGDQPSCMIRSGPWKLMYYSEFDSYLLFNLKKNPLEMHDLSGDPDYKGIGLSLLGKISSRWSAEKVIRCQARESSARNHIMKSKNSAYTTLIHKPDDPDLDPEPGPEDNRFDFDQLPGGIKLNRPTR